MNHIESQAKRSKAILGLIKKVAKNEVEDNINSIKSRQDILEEDINDLMGRIKKEKALKENMLTLIGSSAFVAMGRAVNEKKEDKNYSNYRKLIDLLSKLYNTYNQLSKEDNPQFLNSLVNELQEETKSVHDLMRDSLKSERDNQYRCLSDAYIKLINLIDNIKKNRHTLRTVKEVVKESHEETIAYQLDDSLCSQIVLNEEDINNSLHDYIERRMIQKYNRFYDYRVKNDKPDMDKYTEFKTNASVTIPYKILAKNKLNSVDFYLEELCENIQDDYAFLTNVNKVYINFNPSYESIKVIVTYMTLVKNSQLKTRIK